MALKAVGVEQGDYVFCQSLTFSASANPITYEKAIPVFIDSEEESWNMDPSLLEQGLERYKREFKLPKAVIVVHLYGICAKIDKIAAICKRYNVPLIEDAAESLGTMYKGKYTGTFGDYGIISFNGNKIITSSGGGMLLVNHEDAEASAKKVLFWSTQAREQARWYQHKEIGYNYRMSNVVAGIGRGQLKILDRRVQKKRYIYDYYLKHIGDLPGLTLMPLIKDTYSNCWLTTIQLSDDCKVKPIDIMLALEEDDVESRPVWKPLHLQPVFEECEFISNKSKNSVVDSETGADDSVAGTLFRRGVCIPSDTKMTDEDMDRVCNTIRKLWK